MRNKFGLNFIILLFIFMLNPITSNANILIISPHPDDDIIMASGIIYHASQRGEPVYVVYMTNGDYSGLDAGFKRQTEAVNAQSYLGTSEDDIIFLGYPDGSLNTIFDYYFESTDVYISPNGQSQTYGKRGRGLSDYHTYAFGSPALYNRYNIVLDLKTIIDSLLPEHIFVTSEYDKSDDHIATYRFMNLALNEIFSINPAYNPTIHKTIIWASNSATWPNAYDPTVYLDNGLDLTGTGLVWAEREQLDVPISMQSLFYAGNPKYLAASAHITQLGASSFLGRWIHKDEIFWVEQLRGTNQPPVVNAGFDQFTDEGTTVQLNASASFDQNGDPLTYAWRQVDGIAIELIDTNVANPTFTAPSDLLHDEMLTFELIVGDGELFSVPDSVNIIVKSSLEQPIYTNITSTVSSVTASSVNADSDPANVIDGCIDGYPENPDCEWTSLGEKAGAWIQLNWDTDVAVSRVSLSDRVNLNDQVLQGVLSFSDGSFVEIGLLDNIGRPGVYTFPPRQTNYLRFTVTRVTTQTSNIGFSEIQVFTASAQDQNIRPSANANHNFVAYEGDEAQLIGIRSCDPNGDSINYHWTQISGVLVTMSDPLEPNPSFMAPTGLNDNEVLEFELVVNDGELDSEPAYVSVTVELQPEGGMNIAPEAAVMASSENTRFDQLAAKAIDECIDGYPGDITCEWVSRGEKAGAWIQLSWDEAHIVDKVILYDRPNSSDRITGGTIVFSDGSSITVGPLDNAGGPTEYEFSPREITGLTLTVDAVSAGTSNVGLAEIEVFEVNDPTINRRPVAVVGPDQTLVEDALVQLVGAGSYDPNGDAISYQWTQMAGVAVTLSDETAPNPTFITPTGLVANEVLSFELVVSDWEFESDPASVTITVLAAEPENRPPTANAGVNQSVEEGEEVQLDGSDSYDPDGDMITYSWTQTSGLLVDLSDPTAQSPTFQALMGLSDNEVLEFELVVNDGELDSEPAYVSVTVQLQPEGGVNIAPLAEVTASSENSRADQLAAKAIDGCIDGYPGDATCEWASRLEKAGAWIQLSWDEAHIVDKVILYDRPNSSDRITGGTIVFSDGSSITVGPLDNAGGPTEYVFSPREITTGLTLTVDAVSTKTSSVGLAEIEVFEVNDPTINRRPVAVVGPDQTVVENAFIQLNGSGSFDPDGDAITYQWTQVGGLAVTLSDETASNPTFTAPTGLVGNETLIFELVVSDWELESDPASVTITVLAAEPENRPPTANAGINQSVEEGEDVQLNGSGSYDPDGDMITYSWTQTSGLLVDLSDATAQSPTFQAPMGLSDNEVLEFELVVNDGELDSEPAYVSVTVQLQPEAGINIAPLAGVTASSENTRASQLAIKAIDECIDGYPGDATCEWASRLEKAGAWIQLSWDEPYIVDKVILYDRPNSSDQILSGTIEFSDGSTIVVGPLDNGGGPTEYEFSSREITGLTLTVDSVSTKTSSVGLAEIEVFEVN